MQSDPETRDPFAEIVGRALLEPGYRDGLMNGSDQDKIDALMNAGLTQEEAVDVLPLLKDAVMHLTQLANHEAFGTRLNAA